MLFIRLNNDVFIEGFLVKTVVNGQIILKIMPQCKMIHYSACKGQCSQSLLQLDTVFNEIGGVLNLKSYCCIDASVNFSLLTGFQPLTFIELYLHGCYTSEIRGYTWCVGGISFMCVAQCVVKLRGLYIVYQTK